MRVSAVLVCSFALLLASCAIHPLPEDVTRNTTFDIVRKIRCEGLEALDNISIRLLRTSTYPPLLEAADRIAAGELRVVDFMSNPKYRAIVQHLDPSVQWLFEAYTLTAVTFDFEFMITEDNNNQVVADFGMLLTRGLFSIGGANAGAKFDRQTDRRFQVTNSFFELHLLDHAECGSISAKIGNLIYPITGKIGLEEVFDTFVKLDSGVTLVSTTTSRFSDTLTFTTTLSAGVAPKITLNPGPVNQLRLSDATVTLTETRTDVHKVAVSLAKGALIKSLDQARLEAKKASKIVADQRRMEDFFILPRDKVIVVQ
jgi:hypothetical protein